MSFFKKLKNRLFKSSKKIDEGLEAIVGDGGEEETIEIDVEDRQDTQAAENVDDGAEAERAAAEALEAQRAADAARQADTARQAEQDRLAAQERKAKEERAAQAERDAQQAAADAERRAQEERDEAARQAAEKERLAEQERLAEAERQAEAARKAQAERQAEAERIAAEERIAAAQSKAEAERIAEQERQAEAARRAEAARLEAAEQAARAEREAEAERKAEEERKAQEQRVAQAEDAKRRDAEEREAEARRRAEAERQAEEDRARDAEKLAAEKQERETQAAEQAAQSPPPSPTALAPLEDEVEEGKKPGLFGRLLGRKQKTTVIKRVLDDDMLEQLEELLITADMGVDTALRVTANMAEGRFGKKLSVAEIKGLLASEVTRIMDPVAKPMPLYPKKPQVVLVVGVNGSGKTTTIGKLASQFRAAGKNVVIAAGDTFRAAAVEQLQIWGERAGVPVLTAPEGSDPASLAFDAMAQAERDGADLLMIDTAGRLQNRADLMEELAKIVRVIRKKDPEAPHNTLLVLDATTGQNALSQVKTFQELADVSGLVMTKLDGTAKGGVLVALADKFGLPIHAIGVGEQIDDLAPFDPEDFANALTGLEGSA